MVERLEKKNAFLAFFSLLLFGFTVVSTQEVSNLSHMIVATIGGPETVDPAWAYDSFSQELIFNVYETLIFYDRENVSLFVPMLAMDWHISEDSLTYAFEIREGVRFHNGEVIATEDVEYSFERAMVQDRRGGPRWMLYEPLLGCLEANLSDPEWGARIDNAVQRNATHVWFNLIKPYAPFPHVLCGSLSSIVNKDFCVDHGDWPGTWDNWQEYHDPVVSHLDTPESAMCGTGPYRFDYWIDEYFGEYSLAKFDDYWQGWPAQDCDGYVSRVTVKFIPDWIRRKEMFLNRTADIIYVPRENIEELESTPGIRCFKNLPLLHCNAVFFVFNVNTTSPYMGVPGGLPPGTFNETGIPPDFFNDTNVRRGFAHSFNWTRYIEDDYTYRGEAIQPATPIVEGLPYRNPDQEKYCLNFTEAEECFKRAWNGEVWEKGFTMTVVYNVGAIPRYIWIEALKDNVQRLNPKFHINMQEVDWPTLLENLLHKELPMFLLGWLADYPDPHDFVYPFMHSQGDFAYFQRYRNPTVDALIEEGIHTINKSRRCEIYYELQSIYHNECPSIPTAQVLTRHWEQDWVQGWYHNPAYPGNYIYHLWKQSTLFGDLNLDGVVDILDVVTVATAFGSEPGDPNWNPIADLVQNEVIDIFDVVVVAKNFGKTP